jgi:hypothetical protein
VEHHHRVEDHEYRQDSRARRAVRLRPTADHDSRHIWAGQPHGAQRVQDRHPSLAPGKEITLFFDQFPARLGKGLPLTYNVQVSYKDPAGKPYSEPTVLDLPMYLGTGGVTRHDIHDVHTRLKEIADSMKRWTDFSGLKVMTRADIERRNEEREARYAEIEAAETAGSNDPGASNDSPA